MKRSLFAYVNAMKVSLAAVACAISISGCMEKELYEPPTEGNDDVTLNNYFDFTTTRNVKLNIDYGTDCSKAYFEVYAENPLEIVEGQVVERNGLMHIASGFTDENGVYDKKASIPASVSKVYIYSPDFGVPTLYETEVSGDAINAKISFDNEIDISSMIDTRTVMTRASVATIAKYIPNKLANWDSKGTPANLDEKLKITVDGTLKSYITAYFPEKVNNSSSPYITDDADITIYKDAHVSINYFGGKTDAKSVFAYYCYDINASKEEIEKAAKNACVIFANAHPNSLGVYSGVGVQLQYIDAQGKLQGDVIPANTKIGFLLWNNGWTNSNNGTFANNTVYSTRFLNKRFPGHSHTAVFGGKDKEGKEYNIITMEDWNDWDTNDVAFVISTDPAEAIVVPPAPDPIERTGTDSFRGLLGFEDNWPNQGDYDMNDVVMNYATNVDYNFENNIIQIVDKFTLSWTGADFRNGFAYEVPFDLSQAEVTITGGSGRSSVTGNVITLYDDAKSELGVSDISASDMPGQDVKEVSYVVSIRFKDPSIDKSTVIPPYNPFIKLYSGCEVHLTNYPPTANAKNTFPNGADISTGNGTYFICKDGYPFAIHMDARLDESLLKLNLKPETVRIDETYPGFKKWVDTRDPAIKWW